MLRLLVLGLLLLVPVAPLTASRQPLIDLIAVGSSATDLLRGVATDTRALLRDFRRPDPLSYQPSVKGLIFRTLTLKGKIADLHAPQPLQETLEQAVELADSGTADLQRCLDQLSVLADSERSREADSERELLLATLTRTQKTLEQLMATLERATELYAELNGRPATPAPPTPLQ